MRIVTSSQKGYCECTVPATAHSITLPATRAGTLEFPIRLPEPVFGDSNAEVRIFVESEADQIQNVVIPGLTQPAQHRWVYEWRFGKIAF